jgi:spermidine synthase
VTWTRLLTLRLGHTTAAASTVVAAFMGGLALGAALAGRFAPRLRPRQSLLAYAILEAIVIVAAVTMTLQLAALTPVLHWAYRDGAPGALFPLVRIAASFAVLLIPSVALGATFPIAVRWFVAASSGSRDAGTLYAANVIGAAIGSLGAGFLLIPRIGVSGTTLVGAVCSSVSIAAALYLARSESEFAVAIAPVAPSWAATAAVAPPAGRQTRQRPKSRTSVAAPPHRIATDPRWLAAVVVALTGVATFVFEIAWMRVFALLVGPSTYAFAATLALFIGGLAIGSIVGAYLSNRVAAPGLSLALALMAAAIAAAWATSFAGGPLPRLIANGLAESPQSFMQLLARQSAWMAALILPAAIGLGIAFPLALSMASRRDPNPSSSIATVYAINTIAGVSGSLLAGFVILPMAGLQNSLRIATIVVLAAAVVVSLAATIGSPGRIVSLTLGAAAALLLAFSPPWDRALLASGAYKYARYVPAGVDLEASLTAGELLYYRDGATATVSVKNLTNARSLAIDGKVDASTGGDMITQKVLAHLPLLLHPDPKTVAIIGLGSGVTLGAALTHGIDAADVVEISPEVVEASQFFTTENRGALSDPRTRLIVGDGRSHLALSSRTYDVIVSEPSNPWMAGVAALFTREFFLAARDRLSSGGILCQWTHTYDISSDDLRSIAATFTSVFPHGTMWLIGESDLLLIGSDRPLEQQLEAVDRGWTRPGVTADLATVGVADSFGLLASFVGGREQLAAFAAGAPAQRDNTMALEFSGPGAVNTSAQNPNTAMLLALRESGIKGSAIVSRAVGAATAQAWRNRGGMLMAAEAAGLAFDDYARAMSIDPADAVTTFGLVRASVPAGRTAQAVTLLERAIGEHPATAAPMVALSRLKAGTGAFGEAVRLAVDATGILPPDPAAFEQLASLYTDAGNPEALSPVVEILGKLFPKRSASLYYAGALAFMRGDLPGALDHAQSAVRADAANASAHNLIGAIYASRGELPNARVAFRAALAADPHDITAYTNLGRLELDAGSPESAARLFAEALTLEPGSQAARQGLAQARSQRFQ